MKTSLRNVLIISLMLAASIPAAAEGFFDMFLGGATFAPVDTTESQVKVLGNGFVSAQSGNSLSNVQFNNSIAGGLRVGGMHKWERFSLGGAFVTDFYSAKAKAYYPIGAPAFNSIATAQQGGFVLQPGIDVMAGIPLRFVRLYGGAGLCTPIMFYNYTGFNNVGSPYTYTPNSTGASGALGYNLFAGGRWLISNHFNLFLEDRFTNLFTPLVIKNSFYSTATGGYDSSFTFKTLNSNRVVAGVGFAW
jgi:hypothetical protein